MLLGISDDRILENEAALRVLFGQDRPLVFVDDFVGSGQQFVSTWRKRVDLGAFEASFADMANNGAGPFYYCPAVCCETGFEVIRRNCPDVIVAPAHFLPSRYSVFADDSIVWPSDRVADGRQFIEETSRRAGIPDVGGGEKDWRGFAKLGLTIAFEHGVPDATLPLFSWREGGWKPLKIRS